MDLFGGINSSQSILNLNFPHVSEHGEMGCTLKYCIAAVIELFSFALLSLIHTRSKKHMNCCRCQRLKLFNLYSTIPAFISKGINGGWHKQGKDNPTYLSSLSLSLSACPL